MRAFPPNAEANMIPRAAVASGMRGACAYELAGDGDDVTCKLFHLCLISLRGSNHSQDQQSM